MFKVNNKNTWTFSNVSIADFEQENIRWVSDSNAEFFMSNFFVPFLENLCCTNQR